MRDKKTKLDKDNSNADFTVLINLNSISVFYLLSLLI